MNDIHMQNNKNFKHIVFLYYLQRNLFIGI